MRSDEKMDGKRTECGHVLLLGHSAAAEDRPRPDTIFGQTIRTWLR